jgi:DNA-binding MarR family transcriptional regulator
MSGNPGRYLAKLQAVAALGSPNASTLADYLDIGYETARSAMRRLEAAGFVLSVRQRGKARTETVTYRLTQQGLEALSSGAEPIVPADGYAPLSQSPAFAQADALLSWRDLHDAMGMGRAVQPRHARIIARDLDREPVGRWSA